MKSIYKDIEIGRFDLSEAYYHSWEDMELNEKQRDDQGLTGEEARKREFASADNQVKRKSTGTPDEDTAIGPEDDTKAWDDLDDEVLEGELLEAEEVQELNGENAEEWKDRFLRLSADFDNFRKRTLRDKEDWSKYASQNIMEKLLPIADNLDAAEAAVTNANTGAEAQSLAEGLRMIHRQFMDVLGQEGLSEIPSLGELFDPNVHEAVMTVATAAGQKENEIAAVLRKGYLYKDKVLRPSMVQVAKNG